MRYTWLCFVLFAALFAANAAGQQKTPTPTPKPEPPLKPQPTQSTPSLAPERQFGSDSDREIMLTGRLLMSDGIPPPDMLPVGLACLPGTTAGGNVMSDLRGEFRFRLKLPYGPSADAETRRINHSCSVFVSIPGYQIISKNLPDLTNSIGKDLGIFVLRPLSQAEGSLVSLNGLKAPESARKELMKAREELAKEKLDSAKSRLEKATRIYPEYATAWYELGRLQARQGDVENAAESYRTASNADPKYVSPQIELALMHATAQQWLEAEQRAASILNAAPEGLPGIYLVHSIACYNLKRMDSAEKSARAGLDQDKSNRFPKLANILGTILAHKGDKKGAADAFRQYLERIPEGSDASRVRRQLETLSEQ